MSRSKKITIIILGVLTLLFAGASIYLVSQLSQQDVAPDDSSAATKQCGSYVCVRDGVNLEVVNQDCNYTGPYSCPDRALNYCKEKYGSRTIATPLQGPSCSQSGGGTEPPLTGSPQNKNIGDECIPNQELPELGGCDGDGPLVCSGTTGLYCPPNTPNAGKSVCMYGGDASTTSARFLAACGSPGSGGTPNSKCVTTSGIAVPNGYIECYTNSTQGRQCGPNGWIENVNADACGYRSCPNPNNPSDNDTGQCSAFAETGFVGCGPISGYTIVRRDEGNLPDSCYNCYLYDQGKETERRECYFEGSSCGARVECYQTTITESPTAEEPPSNEPPPPPPSDSQCGDTCSSNNDCVEANNVCDGGVCKLNVCATNPSACNPDLCSVITPSSAQCGEACTSNSDCTDQDNVCDNGVCKLNICATNPSACNQDLCSVPPTNQVGSVTGTAYCEDSPGTRYPIANSFVTLTLNNGTQTIVQTDANGNYTFSNLDNPNDTTAPYVVDVTHSLPQGSLSNGQAFSALVGPNAINCSNNSLTGCSAASCGQNNQSYASCQLDDGENGTNFDFVYTNCEPLANACIGLTEVGPDPVDSGDGNVIVYILEYQSSQTTNPFPNIRLRVGPSASPVGRDDNNTTSALVAPASVSYNTTSGIWTYYFEWEAYETNNTDVSDGTYDVRILTDGTSDEITEPSCTEQVTVTEGTTQEPVFNIVKSSADICLSNGSAQIDYTITATNIGPVSGTIDYVEDTFDPRLTQFGITPIAITPSFGVVSSGSIRWEGSVSERTFAAGQSKNYTYRVIIPQSLLINFTLGVNNEAELAFTTDETNTLTFSLNTPIQCSIPGIPDTSISDSRLLLLGMILIIISLIVYQTGIGSSMIQQVLDSGVQEVDKKVTKLMPFEERLQKAFQKRRKK